MSEHTHTAGKGPGQDDLRTVSSNKTVCRTESQAELVFVWNLDE